MSTFDGLVREFPTIRIDYFRNHPGRPAPAALFLSHVHSDHLVGLESVKMPFVYCSATTRRILLKMEKYPHRINFAKGVLEARKQHYKHLKTVLRAIPMNTATKLELGPKLTITATLLDANHCPGAVMFLIEGDGRAILYTGDVRAEPWWVNSITQNPLLLPYTCGLRQLDCIYLDTTFATHDEPYRHFPTKAEGLKELLEKVRDCPPDTIFYFRAWTLGYENVWLALSNFLRSQVHVNQYQLRIFRDGDSGTDDSASLTGFTVGNSQQPGCLTLDETARIHSCEPGLDCHSKIKKLKNVVWITPIISRLKDGSEIRELGAGGGWKDLYPTAQLKLEDSISFQQLLSAFANMVDDGAIKLKMAQALAQLNGNHDLSMALDDEAEKVKVEDDGSVKLTDFMDSLSKSLEAVNLRIASKTASNGRPGLRAASSDTIHFPYSRHSSYDELRHLVDVFRPKDICACTVCPETWSEELSMQSLFGDLCSEQTFYFDQGSRELFEEVQERSGLNNPARSKRKRDDDEDSQKTASQDDRYHEPSSPVLVTSPIKGVEPELIKSPLKSKTDIEEHGQLGQTREALSTRCKDEENCLCDDSDNHSFSSSAFDTQTEDALVREGAHNTPGRFEGTQKDRVLRKQARIEAYNAARVAILGNDSSEWDAVPLRSIWHQGHDEEEVEL